MCIRDRLASVDEIDRGCEERLGWQRANFPRVYCETEFSQMFYEDSVSSRGYVEDEVSSSSPLIFCNSKFVVPFAWNEVVPVCCDRCYYEKYVERERMIEVFKLNRGYEGLVKRLKCEGVNYMKYLPVVVDVDGYFDDTTVDDEHLPCEVMDIVDEYDDITYLGITNNIKRDWTKIINVDKVYELSLIHI